MHIRENGERKKNWQTIDRLRSYKGFWILCKTPMVQKRGVGGRREGEKKKEKGEEEKEKEEDEAREKREDYL